MPWIHVTHSTEMDSGGVESEARLIDSWKEEDTPKLEWGDTVIWVHNFYPDQGLRKWSDEELLAELNRRLKE